MTRTENDLRGALRELEQRADHQGAPSTATILGAITEQSPEVTPHHLRRWLPPLAAAAVVAAAAVTAAVLSGGHSASPRHPQAGGQGTGTHARASKTTAATHSAGKAPGALPAGILADAATKLDAAPWTTPPPQDFYYVHTTEATTWTSVSGRQAGDGRAADGTRIWVPGCRNDKIVSTGEAGTCTLNGTPHYLAAAPTAPAAWDAYLEQIAPGAKAGDAQGKVIAGVLHEYLVAPKAAAALLRYTETCPGLHTVAVRPVSGEKLTGVTCTSMTNGSYGLAFDASSHALVGFVVVNSSGQQVGPAEIVLKTGIVAAIGRTP